MLAIAEIGINHNGNFKWIEEMLRQLSMTGVDIAKFQLYESQKIFGDDSRKHHELSFDQVHEIYELCQIYNIEFMASVFDEERFNWCEKIGVQRYKLASRTVAKDYKLCDTVISTGKEVFASLGMWDQSNLPFFRENVKYLHCISRYPTSIRDVTHVEFDDRIVGVSDHSYGIGYILYCIAHGAVVFEKHFTLSKSLEGNDHIGSMTIEELQLILNCGKQIELVRKIGA